MYTASFSTTHRVSLGSLTVQRDQYSDSWGGETCVASGVLWRRVDGVLPGKTNCPRKRLGTSFSEGEARRLFGRQLDLARVDRHGGLSVFEALERVFGD